MKFEPKIFELKINGLSEQLLKNHLTLYQGYVTNTNKLLDTISVLIKENKTSTPEFAELSRRFAWEFNGMRLHELYFSNLGKNAFDSSSKLSELIKSSFGSFENWEKHFKALGSMRGIGWVLLVQDKESKQLFNVWVNEHDLGLLANSDILLIMDVFEHAFMIDYGLKKADYIETFFKNIDWKAVQKRLN
ncbi:superoxide dismutase [Candidatus Woesearchaeota archaeon]|nr:superoxide dismutase [Candidatus Woesearchaeota archaeon]